MRKNRTLKIALVPTRRGISSNRKGAFTVEDALRVKAEVFRYLEETKPANVEYVTIDFLNDEGIMYDEAHAQIAAEFLKQQQIDGLFILHCNFGCEEAVGRLCAILRKPVFLWGPRDAAIAPDGSRSTDTQCGLFASSRLLRRHGVAFTYAENCVLGNPAMVKQYEVFLGAVRAAKALSCMRIGQVCARPKYFTSVMINESALIEQLGIEVIPVNLAVVEEKMKKIAAEPDYLQTECAQLRSKMDCSTTDKTTLENSVLLKMALREIAEQYQLDGLAIECWTIMPQTIQALPCLAIGELSDEGIPCCCETDIYGVIGSLLLQAAGNYQQPPFFGEYTMRDNADDNKELIWHCGNAPYSLRAETATPAFVGGREAFSLRNGEITVVRFDCDRGQFCLFADEAEAIDGAFTAGTYFWAKMKNWPAWERHFVYGPYIHHVSCAYGHYKEVLRECCKYVPAIHFDCVYTY